MIGDPAIAGQVNATTGGDLEEMRTSYPIADVRFIVQFQAAHSENYGNTLTQSQLVPIIRSVYGTLQLAYPLAKTSHHDEARGIYTLLATGTHDTYDAWVTLDHWPHISTLLGNYWQVILVAEVGMRCDTAEAALDSLGMATRAGSGSE
jgi:hypothetical protein